tara:strand:+ start:368 stop:502 length:135 start_codon:yes stop_codon:yes gene_type:complete
MAVPLAGAGGTVRSELKYKELENRIKELETIVDYLIQQDQGDEK